MINVSVDIDAAVTADSVRYAVLLKIEMDTPIYLTSHYKDITYDSNTYDSSAHVVSIGNIKQSSLAKNPSTTIVLSGVDQTYYSLFLTEEYINRIVTIFYVLLDADGVMIDVPVQLYSGDVSDVTMKDDPAKQKATVSVKVEGSFGDFDRVTGRLTNTDSQKEYFPLDKGFEFTRESGDYSEEWGGY